MKHSTITEPKWVPFWFHSNKFLGLVGTPAGWKDLLAYYDTPDEYYMDAAEILDEALAGPTENGFVSYGFMGNYMGPRTLRQHFEENQMYWFLRDAAEVTEDNSSQARHPWISTGLTVPADMLELIDRLLAQDETLILKSVATGDYQSRRQVQCDVDYLLRKFGVRT